MLSKEPFIRNDSNYFVYSPSKNAMEMFLYPLQCGQFTYLPGYRLVREAFDSFLLMYIQKGTLALVTGDTWQHADSPVIAGAGNFVLLDCYSRHAYSTDTGWSCLWCHFDGITARHWYQNIITRLGNVFALADAQPVIGKLSAVYDTFRNGRPVREPLLSKYMTDILTAFLLSTPTDARTNARMNMSETITTYISEHLNTARYLLKNTALPVKDICFSTGFSCESIFCTAFKRIEGMTPARRCRDWSVSRYPMQQAGKSVHGRLNRVPGTARSVSPGTSIPITLSCVLPAPSSCTRYSCIA